MFSPLFVTNYCLVQVFFFLMYLDTIFHSLKKKVQCFIFGNIKPTSLKISRNDIPSPQTFQKMVLIRL